MGKVESQVAFTIGPNCPNVDTCQSVNGCWQSTALPWGLEQVQNAHSGYERMIACGNLQQSRAHACGHSSTADTVGQIDELLGKTR